MKYTGKMFYRGSIVPDGNITDAIILPKRISIDWDEDGSIGHLESNSSDGVNFQGQCLYEGSDPNDFKLKRYECGHDILLFGTWYSPSLGETGTWNFELTPGNRVTKGTRKRMRQGSRAE